MDCYGNFNPARDRCRECELAPYCRTAADPPPLPRARLRELGAVTPAPFRDRAPAAACYTRQDLLEVISFMAALDVNTLELVSAKLGNPDATCEELARLRGLTRQAVHKTIKKWCRSIPELETLLRNRQCQNRSHAQTTFMEEVCKIRLRVRRKNSKSPVSGSNVCRSLISWKPSFDLSRMSIFKGSAILRRD